MNNIAIKSRHNVLQILSTKSLQNKILPEKKIFILNSRFFDLDRLS